MTVYVERYRVCKRCDERSPVKSSIENRISMSYHGKVGDTYHRDYDVHLCEVCSEEFLQWMKGAGE